MPIRPDEKVGSVERLLSVSVFADLIGRQAGMS
jgi:hypothetical protein